MRDVIKMFGGNVLLLRLLKVQLAISYLRKDFLYQNSQREVIKLGDFVLFNFFPQYLRLLYCYPETKCFQALYTAICKRTVSRLCRS